MARQIIGISFGNRILKIAVNKGGRIVRILTEPMPEHYVVENQVVSPEAMGQWLREVVKRHRLSGRSCGVVLPSSAVLLRRMKMPMMTAAQLKLNLPYEFRDFIMEGKEKYDYDYMVVQKRYEEKGQPIELDLMGAAVSKRLIAEYDEICRRAGLRLSIAAPSECCYSNLIRNSLEEQHLDTSSDDFCIVDLGHSSTRLHIYSGYGFEVSKFIDYGGAALDAAIAEMYNVEPYLAATYKESNYQDVLHSEACQNIYRTIAVEIMKGIHFYGFHHPASDVKQIYYCGGNARIAPLLTAIGEAAGLKMESIESLMPVIGVYKEAALCAAASGITLQ